MYILGLNAYHGDASAVVVKNGVVIAAAEEERFNRTKHWAGIPTQAIQFCLQFANIDISDISHVAINSDGRKNKWKKLKYVLSCQSSLKLILEKAKLRSKKVGVLQALENQIEGDWSGIELMEIEHHLCHLASAYYPSGFQSAALLSVDGFGDFSSSAMGQGNGSEISIDEFVHFPHSLGIFYQAITQYLGFPNYGDEYKVMGLSSYGSPDYVSSLQEVLQISRNGNYQLGLKFFRHHKEPLGYEFNDGVPQFDRLYSTELEKLLGPARDASKPIAEKHQNIAASAQHLYEQALFGLLNKLHAISGSENLAIAGGCGMNSVANGKIIQNTPFKKVYVQPAAGDAGGAMGAALVAWQKLKRDFDQPVMPDAYLGPAYSSEEISDLVANTVELSDSRFEVSLMTELDQIEYVVEKLIGGFVIGWFQGRMEWGARALGNRSILADPRRDDMQELLNNKIKRREGFRPFAPSILSEHVSEWFEAVDDVPYMEKVYPIKKSKHHIIPAVTHVDGSGRLQTVDKVRNPKYYQLIESFYRKTQVPVLLNTSFNENEPIVCTPEQALQCFLRTKMDVLALGNYTIARKQEI